MKLSSQTALGTALLLFLSDSQCLASAAHRRAHMQLEKRQHHGHGHAHLHEQMHEKREEDGELVGGMPAPSANTKRTGVRCSFPNDPDLVAVTPGADNGGWAMSPDQPCTAGTWCPIACRSGKVMAQWEPNSTYTYPASMNGGLFCEANGVARKPFDNKPFCVDGTGAVSVTNETPDVVSFCQTILPGNEAMLSPTVVGSGSSAVLAVPGPTYWCGTAAHFYINPPGVGGEGCIWGNPSRPVGNWSPYVAGANTVTDGTTFVKVGYNPIWTGCDLSNTKPTFGVRITCEGGGCNGLPCEIDPSKNPVGVVTSSLAATGAGGANFCVVTVPRGGKANIEVFDLGGKGPAAPPPSTSATPPPPPRPSSSSSAAAASSSSSAAKPSSSSSSESDSSSSSRATYPTVLPGIFHENGTHAPSTTGSAPVPTTTSATNTTVAPSSSQTGEGVKNKGGAAVAGLVVALVAAACLY